MTKTPETLQDFTKPLMDWNATRVIVEPEPESLDEIKQVLKVQG